MRSLWLREDTPEPSELPVTADIVAALAASAPPAAAPPAAGLQAPVLNEKTLNPALVQLQIAPNGTCVIERRGVLVDVDKRTAIANGHVVNLTRQEFELLHVLVSRPGIVLSREALLSKVWGGDTYVIARTVDAVISRLRRKLEVKPHDPQLILTVWGVGYKSADVE